MWSRTGRAGGALGGHRHLGAPVRRGLCTNPATSCVPGGKDLSTGIIDFYLGPDSNQVAYTNQAR